MKIVNAYILVIFLSVACKKSTFLEANPDNSKIVPKTVEDCQAILDNLDMINGFNQIGVIPAFGEAGADNYFIDNSSDLVTFFGIGMKNIYIWNDNIYQDYPRYDWAYPYRAIFYANTVLDVINSIVEQSPNDAKAKNIKGSAHFIRGQMFYHLAQIFAPPYNESTALTEMGIVLKTSSDIGENMFRSNLEETYQQIILDLSQAADLLPNEPLGNLKTRPSKRAAFALLARNYLSMRRYDQAEKYAGLSLDINDTLLDYNNKEWIDEFNFYSSFKQFNPEEIYHCNLVANNAQLIMPFFLSRVDTLLVASYHENDLRKTLFFADASIFGLSGNFFKGSYDGSIQLFAGLANDELYLIRAECRARSGNLDKSLDDLNKLLLHRWSKGLFTSFVINDQSALLAKILEERRKELLFRGIRWSDLRRLNMEGAEIVLNRKVDGETYTLMPNSLKYTYLIPPDVISATPGIQQNKR